MNRIFRFRVYDTGEKRMSAPFGFDSQDAIRFTNPSDMVPIPFAANNNDRFIFLQFTGIYDKSNREIYEGYEMSKGNFVEYVDGSFCINGDCPLSVWAENHEVTGNLWERSA